MDDDIDLKHKFLRRYFRKSKHSEYLYHFFDQKLHISHIRSYILPDMNESKTRFIEAYVFFRKNLEAFKNSNTKKYMTKDIPWFKLEIDLKNKYHDIISSSFTKINDNYIFCNKIVSEDKLFQLVTQSIYNRNTKNIKNSYRKLICKFKNNIKNNKLRLLIT